MSPYDPTWASLETHEVPEWFADARFGVYFHWGPYAVPAFGSEWYPRKMYQERTAEHAHHVEEYGNPAEFGYREFVREFDAEAFDPDEWARLCEEAGARYVGITAIHHDGFAMWDSELTEYNAADVGPERDVLGDLAAAVRDRGMKFVAAFHHAWNWWYYPRKPEYDTTDPAHADLYGPPHEEGEAPPESYYADWRDGILEVVDAYRPELLWFDFGWGHPGFVEHDRYRREVLAHYYNAADEWGKEVGVAHKRNLPAGVGIVDYERSRREELAVEPWLTDTSVDRASWGYVDDPDYKDTDVLVRGVVDRASKNGNTLLNVGPRADGTIPDAAAERLRAVGEWLDTGGEAIYGSRPWWTFGEGPTDVTSGAFEEASSAAFTPEDVRFTRGEEAAYAVVMGWPDDGVAEIETPLQSRLTGHFRSGDRTPPEAVHLVPTGERLDWELGEECLRVHLPDAPPEGVAYAYPLRITPREQ